MKRLSNFRIVFQTAFIVCLIFIMAACVRKKTFEVNGYAPVYGDPIAMYHIASESPHPIVNAGKIYQYQNFTFQIENGEGIHIINSGNPSNPIRVGFIKVPGCSEISIKNNILYTDNYQDLVGINIANISSISVASRVEKVFPLNTPDYPPLAGAYFECVDASKGVVIGWTEKLLTNPKCKR